MKSWLSVFLLISLWPGTVGQDRGTVSGRVSDAATGEPMEAVSISADRRTGTISDREGRFSLSLAPGNHFIEFYYVGYEDLRREIRLEPGEVIRLDVGMIMGRRMLDEVVVSAGKYEQKLSDVTISLEVLKPHQLSGQNITSLDEILEKTSGISILDGQPSIRGGSGFSYGVGSRVLMLVDDLPMISADAGDIKWNYMPVENLNQVEVIKGASSVLYGSSALNGVINLRTRFPGNEPQTEVTLFGGTYMDPRRGELIWWDRRPLFTGASFSHLRKIGKLDLSSGGNFYKDQGFRELEREVRIRGNIGLRYRFEQVRGLSAGITASGMYFENADFLLWLNADSGAYRQNPEAYAPLTGHRYNMDPYIEYFTPSGDRHTLRMRLYSVGNATVDIAKSSFAKLYYSEYRFLKKLGGETNWTSGMAYSRNTVLANLYEDHRGSNMAFYSQLDAKLPARVKVSTGVRWEINALNGEFYYSLPVFRAGVNFQATRSTFMRSSFGQGYRFPSVAEKFADADVAGLHIFRNPGLEPERGWSAEAAVKQGFGSGSWAGFMDMAFFWTEYENMIEYLFGAYPEDPDATPTFDDIGFKALNIGTARITGFEFSLNTEGELGPLGIRSTGGYTFMNPVDPSVLRDSTVTREGAHFLKYRRQHLVKVDLELNFGEVFFGVNYQFNSRMVNVDSVFIDPLIGNLLQPGFPDYWKDHSTGYSLVDFRLGWNITGWIRINAILRNALNVEYLGRPGDIGPPRSIIFQTRLEF